MHPTPPQPPPPKKEVQLQGPRPSPLKVNKESVKIKKPPPHPHPHPHPCHHHQQQQQQQQQPVVIYSLSPKVIHATVSEFMPLVQRLTGPSSSPSGDLSPAARLASIHKTSPNSLDHNKQPFIIPTTSTTTSSFNHDHDLMESIINNLEDQGGEGGLVQLDEMCQFPGILSPAPGTMPPIPSGFFSHQHDVLSSLSFMGSPSPSSALFSAPLVSPSPSSWDLFNNFLDYF